MLTRSLVFRVGQLAGGLAVGGLIASGCGNKNDSAPPQTSTGMISGGARTGVGGTGGKGGRSSGGASGEGGLTGEGQGAATSQGGEGGAVEAPPGSPIITITSPQPVSDPNKPGVIVDDQVDVLCTVSKSPLKGAKAVADSSVVMQMLDATGHVAPSVDAGTVAAEKTGKTDQYTARFVMTDVPDNGPVSFVCTGSDTSTPPLTASAQVDTLVDHGPVITLIEPQPNSAHALIGALSVDFTVEPSPVGKGDKGDKVDTVELTVGGAKITGKALVESDGEYTAQVTLTDTTMFPTTPSGTVPILIRATNQRSPDAATRTLSDTFLVDGDGPNITIDSPTNGAIVGRTVDLKFHVSDLLTGVDQSSIVVLVNEQESHFGDTTGKWKNPGDDGDDSYVFTFDSTLVQSSVAQATINISAADNAGNVSKIKSWLLYLDDVPPIVDLDPPNIRSWKKNGTETDCSGSFDPLGNAISDTDASDQYGDGLFRALVWEMTNPSPDGIYSGVDDSTVGFFLQPDPTQPFLVNSPGDPDDDCDDIDEKARQDLEFVGLTPIAPTGAASFAPNDANASPPLSSADFTCTQPTGPDTPPYLCQDESSDLTVVIAQQKPARPPAIYALGPLDSVFCTGRHWEMRTDGHEGWMCVAGRAVDLAGNIGISRPLRICYDNPKTTFVPDCSGPPPSCTDGCTLPPAFPPDPTVAFVRQ